MSEPKPVMPTTPLCNQLLLTLKITPYEAELIKEALDEYTANGTTLDEWHGTCRGIVRICENFIEGRYP